MTAYLLRQGRVKSCGCRLEAYRKAVKPEFGRAVVMVTFRINGRYADPDAIHCDLFWKDGSREDLAVRRMRQGQYRVEASEIRTLPSAAYEFTWTYWLRGLGVQGLGDTPMRTTVWIEKGIVKGKPSEARCDLVLG